MCKVCAILIWQTHNSADVSIFPPFCPAFAISVSISPKTHLFFAVPPMVWIQNQLVGSSFGQKITLECQSEAYPKSINYWMKNDTIITLGKAFISITLAIGLKQLI